MQAVLTKTNTDAHSVNQVVLVPKTKQALNTTGEGQNGSFNKSRSIHLFT